MCCYSATFNKSIRFASRVKLCNVEVNLLKHFVPDFNELCKWLDGMENKAPFRGQEKEEITADRKDTDYIWQLAKKWDSAKVSRVEIQI